jgi:nucleotide-binding universal stress UspA family protein
MFQNILLPVDGSPVSMKAVKVGVRLAREQKARVTAFYMCAEWQSTVYPGAMGVSFVSPAQHALREKKLSDRYLGEVKRVAAAAGVPCTCVRTVGSHPWQEILKAARRNRCDLICIASHGRRGISRLLLGSETSKVLAHSRVPVMVCR